MAGGFPDQDQRVAVPLGARSTAFSASAISPTPPITGVGRIALPLVSL